MYNRSVALGVAKQGFSAAMRRAAYEGTIGQFAYSMDRDDWSVTVTLPIGTSGHLGKRSWKFAIAKSWEV